jgi:hypothetical protein
VPARDFALRWGALVPEASITKIWVPLGSRFWDPGWTDRGRTAQVSGCHFQINPGCPIACPELRRRVSRCWRPGRPLLPRADRAAETFTCEELAPSVAR